MPYPEEWVTPMREELTRIGFQELRTSEEVDATLKDANGTAMVVVNSICGCAAGNARPGVALALTSPVRPHRLYTVFAGQDLEATAHARTYFEPYPPSSPSVALLKEGKIVYMLERHRIEGRPPEAIAEDLATAFQVFCGEGNTSPETNLEPAESSSSDPLRVIG